MNVKLEDARYESLGNVAGGTTLPNLSHLVFNLTGYSTTPSIEAITENLSAMSRAFSHWITNEATYRRLYDITWIRSPRLREDAFFSRYLPNVRNLVEGYQVPNLQSYNTGLAIFRSPTYSDAATLIVGNPTEETTPRGLFIDPRMFNERLPNSAHDRRRAIIAADAYGQNIILAHDAVYLLDRSQNNMGGARNFITEGLRGL